MKIRITVPMSGTRNGEEWPVVGSVVDVTDDEATSYITNGIAVDLDDEFATAPSGDVETATAKRTRRA